jgi:hypothetical protein
MRMRKMQRFSARLGYLGSAAGDGTLLTKSIDASRGIYTWTEDELLSIQSIELVSFYVIRPK